MWVFQARTLELEVGIPGVSQAKSLGHGSGLGCGASLKEHGLVIGG